MANIDDLVTVQKNGVVAINDLTAALNLFRDIYTSFVGTNTYLGITGSSLIMTGAGRLVSVAITSGTNGVSIYDSETVAGAAASNAIYVNTTSAAITQINIPFFNGLVVIPGASTTVCITYSEG